MPPEIQQVLTITSMDIGGVLIVVSALVVIVGGKLTVKILHSSKGG